MYQYLSTCLDRPVKKAIVDLPIRLKGSSKHVLLVIVESVSGLEQGCWHCFADFTNSGQIMSLVQASRTPSNFKNQNNVSFYVNLFSLSAAFGVVPFLKDILGRMLPMMGMAKQDNLKWVIANCKYSNMTKQCYHLMLMFAVMVIIIDGEQILVFKMAI